MASAARLVRQIREAIATDNAHAPLENMAVEYARHGQEANARLDSCAAMLEKGSEYQALQLAETEPALLDLLATLSFAEAPEWVEFCLSRGWPAPVKFDPRAVQALDALYAKGISAHHPLYKDYRAAVTVRDDAKAIGIIRTVVRLNPDDANARSELARLENKLFQLRLQALRARLEQGDEAGTLAELAELERLARPERLAETPEYARALTVRGAVGRREAIAKAAGWRETLAADRTAGAWQAVGHRLARLRALQAEHGFALSESDAAAVAEQQAYFEERREAADEAARFEQARTQLSALAERIAARLRSRGELTDAEARHLQESLGRRTAELAAFPQPAPEALRERARASAEALTRELRRRRHRWQLGLGLIGTAVLVVIAGTSLFTLRRVWGRDAAAELAALRQAGQLVTAEEQSAALGREHAWLTTEPMLAQRRAEIAAWVTGERQRRARAQESVVALEKEAPGGEPAAIAARLASAQEQLSELTSEDHEGLGERLRAVRASFLTQLRAETSAELERLEKAAADRLTLEQPRAALTEALAELDPALKALTARLDPLASEGDALRLRAEAVHRQAELIRGELQALAKTEQALGRATSLEEYLKALGGYETLRLTGLPESAAARALLAGLARPEELLGSLLFPGDPAGWAAAKADASGEAFLPAQVVPGELTRLVALRDDPYLSELREVTFLDLRRKNEKRLLYVRGELKRESATDAGGEQTIRWSGAVYDPAVKTELPGFLPLTLTLVKMSYGTSGDGELRDEHLSAASELLNRLELSRLTDAEGLRYERPLLRLFDELVHDQTAPVLVRGFIMQQLGEVVRARPAAWGLEFCASLQTDLQELTRLCEGVPLRSQDWLLERKRAQYGPRLTSFFATLPKRGYLAEARGYRQSVHAVTRAGLQYAGYCDAERQPHLLAEAREAPALMMPSADRRNLVPWVAGQAAPPFTPLFRVPLDRPAPANLPRSATP